MQGLRELASDDGARTKGRFVVERRENRGIEIVADEREIREGELACSECGQCFTVADGIVDLLYEPPAFVRRERAGLERIAEYSVGIMGRTPDYLNATVAGFAGRADEWSINANERGAANLVAFHKEVARRDLSLTHTIVQPTIDKTRGDVPAAGDEVALHKVEDTAHGIVVRGARILATLAPFSDELFVYPGAPLAACRGSGGGDSGGLQQPGAEPGDRAPGRSLHPG